MIKFIETGLSIDEEGWASANLRDTFIEVYFRNGPRLFIDRSFLEHALDLLNYDRDRRAVPPNSDGVEKP